MKAGIIGGDGFLGSAFVRLAEKRQYDFKIIETYNYSDTIGEYFDVLINANGNSKKYLAEENPKQEFIETAVSVQNSLVDFNCALYVHCSTVDVYHNHNNPEENKENTTIEISQISKYGLHKYIAENLIINYTKSWLIFRFGGLVGPGLKKNSIYDILNNIPLRVHIDSAYQYLSTDFATEAVLKVISSDCRQEVFNLCGDEVVCLKEMIDLLPEYEVRYYHEKPPKERYEINIEKIKQYIDIPSSRTSVFNFINTYRMNSGK